ncbi:MAG: hypothetical protein HON65_13215 [Rhodospirillales bacterium]|nr:hypothetical protein [Rhodospirillales bacterium]
MRFEFGGAVHQTLEWNSFGFKTNLNSDFKVREGDSFVIRSIGYGNLKMIPVMIRAEVLRKEDDSISVRFLQNHQRDRNAFESFVSRSQSEENSVLVA